MNQFQKKASRTDGRTDGRHFIGPLRKVVVQKRRTLKQQNNEHSSGRAKEPSRHNFKKVNKVKKKVY